MAAQEPRAARNEYPFRQSDPSGIIRSEVRGHAACLEAARNAGCVSGNTAYGDATVTVTSLVDETTSVAESQRKVRSPSEAK